MANFTKGPWIAERQKSFSYAIHTNYVHDRGHDCNVVREVRCEANAQLIAAAPELFDALQALLDISDFAEDSAEQNIHAQATAALRKAVGGGHIHDWRGIDTGRVCAGCGKVEEEPR